MHLSERNVRSQVPLAFSGDVGHGAAAAAEDLGDVTVSAVVRDSGRLSQRDPARHEDQAAASGRSRRSYQ